MQTLMTRGRMSDVPPAPHWFTLHIHVSGSGGTSMCQLAKRNGQRVPVHNCELPGKTHHEWRRLLKGHREEADSRSCDGLRKLAREHGTRGPHRAAFTFGMAESPAPHWMGCAGVRYTFLMVEPVRRILTAAYQSCTTRQPNNSHAWWIPPWCDPVALLRASYARPWAVTPDREKGDSLHIGFAYWQTPLVSELNVRSLLDRETFLAPLGALNATHLERAKRRLSTFALASALSRDLPPVPVAAALGWHGALPAHAQYGYHHETKPLVHRALEAVPAAAVALVREHNPFDVALYEWLRSSPPAARTGPAHGTKGTEKPRPERDAWSSAW